MSEEFESNRNGNVTRSSSQKISGANSAVLARPQNKHAGGFQKPSVTDRRQAQRIEHSTDVSVRRLSSKPVAEARSLDISRTGIKLSTPQALPVGSAIQLVLTLPGSDEKRTITGIVVWNKPSHQIFEAGIVFASQATELPATKTTSSSRSWKPAGSFLKPGA